MGTNVFNSPRSSTTEANMRIWMGAWLQGMLDAGFVQTDDVGQIDPPTEVLVTTSTATTAYAMFRFNDSLQATAPIFFKVEFSRNNWSSNQAGMSAIHLTVGKGTDGSGQIVGTLMSRRAVGSNYGLGYSSNVFTASETHIASTGEGYVAFIPFVSDQRTSVSYDVRHDSNGFVIERSRNVSGEPTGDGLMVMYQTMITGNPYDMRSIDTGEYGVLAINYQTSAYISGTPPVTVMASVNGVSPSASNSIASGAIGPVLPWDMVAPGLSPWRSCVIVSIPAGDMPSSVFQANLCGKNSSFMPIPPSVCNGRWGISLTNTSGGISGISRWFGAGIRWED